jgi:hypothetical protein
MIKLCINANSLVGGDDQHAQFSVSALSFWITITYSENIVTLRCQ